MLALKSLTCFADGDLHRLPTEKQQMLVEAVAATAEIPVLNRVSDLISPANR
jgi:hypothetical protein